MRWARTNARDMDYDRDARVRSDAAWDGNGSIKDPTTTHDGRVARVWPVRLCCSNAWRWPIIRLSNQFTHPPSARAFFCPISSNFGRMARIIAKRAQKLCAWLGAETEVWGEMFANTTLGLVGARIRPHKSIDGKCVTLEGRSHNICDGQWKSYKNCSIS